MATEEKTVCPEPRVEFTDESSNNCSKEEVVALDKTAEETVVSDQLSGREKDKIDEVNVDEAEELLEEEGETTAEEVKLDDDENIENPAYIPKTGKYYMHDSREDTEVAREEKKSRADGMWSRDRYDERYQQPRTRKQMIEKYGFDIRLGETKEIAEDNEKRMREAGVDLENEEIEKMEKRGMVKQRYTPSERREPRRLNHRDENPAKSGYNEENNEEDDIRPAARRDSRKKEGKDRGYLGRVEGGEEIVNRDGHGGREGRTGRGDRGRGGNNRQFNRTFNNSNRNSAKDENRDRGAPKRYSTQRVEKVPITAAIMHDNHSIVYFDPAKQVQGENNAPVREKKPLDIVPPS